jgi:hypothetical protein
MAKLTTKLLMKPPSNDLIEFIVDDLFMCSMIGDPSIVVLKVVDVILSYLSIDTHMKELRIGIALFDL